jgi:hypothetical protein
VVTGNPEPAAARRALVAPFPAPGRAIGQAYRELLIAATGTDAQKNALGDPGRLPRPWDPATCPQPELRRELWQWLDAVVTWLNTDYVWDVAAVIPACWPQHPHLVHELAVLADQRRRTGLSLASDALEEWHRYTLPAFHERMRSRIRDHCEDGHQPWPANGRRTRHTSQTATASREGAYRGDLAAVTHTAGRTSPTARLTIVDDGAVVDPETGELLD